MALFEIDRRLFKTSKSQRCWAEVGAHLSCWIPSSSPIASTATTSSLVACQVLAKAERLLVEMRDKAGQWLSDVLPGKAQLPRSMVTSDIGVKRAGAGGAWL